MTQPTHLMGALPPHPHQRPPLPSGGRWLDDPALTLLPGRRDVQLPVPLRYRDRRGVLHTVPADTISDGLTAPAWTWSLIGSPLTPDYRRPAILHDYYCVNRLVPSHVAHQLLEESLEEERPGRLWRWRVAVFGWVVRRWGPRW